MFEELDEKASREGRGRRGASALLSLGIFGGIALAVGGAITAHQVRRHRAEQEQKVDFAELNAIRAPKPKVSVKAATAKKAGPARPKVTDLKSIPASRPEEAEGDLSTTDDTGAIDGLIGSDSTGGSAAPVAPPPAPPPPPAKLEPIANASEQERETVEAPRFLSGCRAPEVPSAILSNAATIRIEVEMMIDGEGKVSEARVLNSHPLIDDDLILQCARAQVFKPAQLPDGTKVPYPFRRRFVFKPTQA